MITATPSNTGAQDEAGPSAPENGWSNGTPHDDTIVRSALRALGDATMVPAAALGGQWLEVGTARGCDVGYSTGFWNAVQIERPLHDPDEWADTLGAVERFADRPGTSGDFDLWTPFQSPDLSRRGWELAGHPPLMWRAPGGTAPRRHAGIEVIRVEDERTLFDWATTAVEAYPLDAAAADIIGPALLDSDRIHLFVAYDRGQAVGVSSTVQSSGLNAVPLIAVRPESRRRGVGAAVTWAASTVRPDQPAVLFSSDAGRGVYEGLGYLALMRTSLWIRHRGADQRV